jgi:hypothetical protein
MFSSCKDLAEISMSEKKLKSFYKYLSLGEFDKALELVGDVKGPSNDSDKVVILALRLKRELQKYLSLKDV